ncbi:MAG: sialidase family protein [bacterium]
MSDADNTATARHLNDDALTPVPIELSPGPKYARADRTFQGIPGIAATSDRDLWVTWYGGGGGEGPDNYVTLARSRDGGNTWAEPVLVIDPPLEKVRAFDPAIWCDPQGRLWVFWAQGWSPENGQIWDGRGGVWCIISANPNDAEPTWSAPRRIADGIMLNKPSVTRDGRWLMPVSIWGHKPHHPDVQGRRLAGLVVSDDQGETFRWLGGADVPKDRIFDEHHVYERADASLVLLARTKRLAARSVSTDRGATWPPAEQCDIPCPNSRFNILRLHSDRLMMVNHHPDAPGSRREPDATARHNLGVWLSDDEGETWRFRKLLDPRLKVSYPDADQSPDGTIHVVYDYDRYGEKNILLASFREEDLDADAPIQPAVIS